MTPDRLTLCKEICRIVGVNRREPNLNYLAKTELRQVLFYITSLKLRVAELEHFKKYTVSLVTPAAPPLDGHEHDSEVAAHGVNTAGHIPTARRLFIRRER